MKTHGVYLVSGRKPYREHPPGSTFEAVMDRQAEQRAIARGDIRLIRKTVPALVPGSFTLPHGWLEPPPQIPPDGGCTAADQEAPNGASLIERSIR